VPDTNGDEVLRRWQSDRPQLLLLDAGLQGTNGVEVCRRIRQTDDTPVILLSDRTDDDFVVQGFRSGADDFVPKPFSPRQLVMRIRAVWRRRGPSDMPEPQRQLQAGPLLLDVDSHEVNHHDRTVRLTPTEFRLLYILAMNAGRVVSGPRLVEYAWGYDETDVALLKTHICHIRSKLQLPRGRAGDIVSVPGVGYRLTQEMAAPPASVNERHDRRAVARDVRPGAPTFSRGPAPYVTPAHVTTQPAGTSPFAV
jgi:DNA-binding response OmpR family regulator